MSGESDWVEKVKTYIEPVLAKQGITVVTGRRLPYMFNIIHYRNHSNELLPISDPAWETAAYQTDMLLAEQEAGHWIPRVIVEFKYKGITTHDGLTYSAKAATHKNVHPYLRYGIVIGEFDGQVPKRLMRHGHYFDFMMTVASENLAENLGRLVELLKYEVEASKTINKLLSEKSQIWLLHRRLEIKS